MAMREQEPRSPPLETARTASDEPQLPGLGPITGGSAATMATGDMASGGAGGEEERGPEGAPDNVRSSSPWVALMSVVGLVGLVGSHIASPVFQRKPRSHVPRAAPSHPWGFKLPVLPPAPAKKKGKKRTAKKRDRPCAVCGATETPLWRTWPTDRRIMLCNACGIRVRAPGAVLPKLLHVHLPPPATATTTVVSELEQPPPQEIQPVSDSPGAVLPEQVHLPPPATATTTTVVSELEQPPPQEIQDSESPPDSPISESMLDFDVYLLKRTSPRREKSPPPPPPPPTAEPAAAPGKKKDEQVKWCLHCGTTSSLQWRTGPLGESTLCNACGVRYRQGRLVPEYRPRASPTFNQSEHSYKHREVLQIRKMQDHPAPPAPFKPIRTRKRRKGKGQHQPAQVRKKRKGNKEQNKPAAQPAAVAVLQVRKKSKGGKTQRLPPEPALLKLRRGLKGKEQYRRPPQPAAAQHLPPPPPPALLPHAGVVDMVLQHLPPPPPAQPHAGYEMFQFQYLPPPPPALPHAADDMEMERHLLPLPPALPHAGDDNDMEQHLLPAQPHAGDELMMGEPIPPPDPFLFDGPAAPRIIDDDEPVIVIVIEDN